MFDYDFDAVEHRRIGADRFEFDRAGFDLFAFPSNAGLIGFDLQRFADRQSQRARARGWQAVVAHQEQFGALAAALVAEATGLPGATPEAVLACQHKLHARRVLDAVCPEANLRYAELPCEYGQDIPSGLSYPAFAKPVKAAFSVLAKRVQSREQLRAHTTFGWRELWVIRRLVEPFERVARARLPGAGSAHRMLLEEPLRAPQYNLDGYVCNGELQVFGVVDAITYPGTQCFQRWQYPSQLPADAVERATDVARRFLAAVGFRHGCFNMEFFFEPATQRLAVIEFNPRLAGQFSDLYRRVAGIDPHAIALALALDEDPSAVPRTAPTAGVAASLVWRALTPRDVPAMPSRAQQAAFERAFPDALLFTYPKSGHSLERDFKWLDSYRYGIVHLGGRDAHDLRQRCLQASTMLGWPNAPYVETDAIEARQPARHATATLGTAQP